MRFLARPARKFHYVDDFIFPAQTHVVSPVSAFSGRHPTGQESLPSGTSHFEEPILSLRFLVVVLLFVPSVIARSEAPDERRPDDLRKAIIADLEDAERMAGEEVRVESVEGVVTLAGTVTSWFEKQMAGAIAKRTRGVKAVVNRILVKPSDREDSEIQSDVEKRLRANAGVETPRYRVQASRGTVSLFGKADSLAEKRLAELAAAGTHGVVEVNNQIRVMPDGDRPDQELRDEIVGLLVHSVYLDDVEIDVQVKNAVARLSGRVGSVDQQDRAEQLAGITGVREVDVEQLLVDPDAGDDSLRQQRYQSAGEDSIRDALLRSLRIDPVTFADAADISVSVDNGRVRLEGKVNRLARKRRASELARDVVGVRQVVNELQVSRPDPAPSNAQIIAEAQEAFRRSPQLRRRDFRVHCQRAHVTLYGVVDFELEKRLAGSIADGVTGVVHVNNALAVERPDSGKSDEEIREDLERKLKFALYRDAEQIDVRVEQGVAILRGEVDTWRQWQAAIDLAIEAGARHPHNLIDVRLHPPHGGTDAFVPH